MKKYFLSQKYHSIIDALENCIHMIEMSRTFKVVSLSIVGFCAGLGITWAAFSAIGKVDNHRGVGGLETATVQGYEENLVSLINEESTASVEDADNILEIEGISVAPEGFEDNFNDESVITYQTYRVKSGDMIGFIADAFNVTQDTIISVNNIRQSRLIQPGQYLKIPSMPGIIYTVKKNGETPTTIAEKYEISAEKCANANFITTETLLSAGTSLFLPDAELDWTTRQEINGDLFHKPLHSRYWLSSSYGWRDSPINPGKRTFHGGIDMAANTGVPIYAALDGKVTATGYNATYGNYVIITHHSGYKTLYGHMSAITCKRGNFVYTNTMIGRVGSTGLSTGPHLHFTVYKNGKTVNPLGLIN